MSKRIWSIRRILLTALVVSMTLLSSISVAIISHQAINSYQTLASSEIKYWANIVSNESQDYIQNAARQALKDNLSISEQIPNLSYLHLYRVNPETEALELFYSYKRNERRSAIPEKSQEVDKLLTPKINANDLEYMQAIEVDGSTIGYVYIQSNTEYLNALSTQLIMISVVVVVVMIIIAILLALRLERVLTAPFPTLTNIMQVTARQKNFQEQCPDMPYLEADMLARNINILFSRVEKHISQLDAAEQQSIEHSQELEDKINQRTVALKESNQELLSTLEKLHQFQGQLVESEKMASLGDMVAGVAHEVNTPIGLGVTASTLLADRLAEIKRAFEDKTLKSSQLKKFLHDGSENIAIIYRNLNRAADLISSFKQVAVDQSSEEVRSFDVKELFNEVFITLGPKLHSLPYVIDIDCPDNLTIASKPGPINQIVINLIMNSIIHGFDGRDEGRISISVMQLGNQLNMQFSDDGVGVNESIKNKVFEPFTTTKRGEGGSGLGLHLVYNLVTQALGGTITLTSEVGHGVNIEINFPID
ncbi:sensor histidine kinase [Colwellia chukchiensis]|nr:HAMP domain-containing sensor histidine kinase [Colwellia chukchiensis]